MNFRELHLHWGQCKYKGKTYRSYSLARAYRKEGKNRKEIICSLGKLTEEEAANWQTLLKGIKNPDSIVTVPENIIVAEHFAYLDVAAVNAIWDYWKLDDVFKNNGRRDVSISTIARILTINRCIDPVSKSQAAEWVKQTVLPWLLGVDKKFINTSRIFRELEIIEKHKEVISEHIFNLLSHRSPESMKSVFYDLSSTVFTGSRCVLMKWGHCKEGYRNHVVLAIVVNKDGLPFYWEVLPGGTADATTIIWLAERLRKRFRTDNTTLVFDRGMVSDENLTLLENEEPEIKYITAMDKSQIRGITNIDFSAFSDFESDNIKKQVGSLNDFIKINDNTYYREVKVENGRRYILCFNPQLFKDQRKAREQAIENYKMFADSLNAELKDAKKSRQRKTTYSKFKKGIKKYKLTSFLDVELNIKYVTRKKTAGTSQKIRSYQGTVKVFKEDKLIAGELDGFWLLVTNHTERADDLFNVSAKQAIAPYRDKFVIEAAFRDIKSFVQVAPVHVWTETHVKAHYTICVLSYLINRTLTLRLHENEGNETKNVVSHEKLYKILSSCMIDHIVVENVGVSTYNLTRTTAEQIELLERIDFKKLISKNDMKKVKFTV
jgi:transposase